MRYRRNHQRRNTLSVLQHSGILGSRPIRKARKAEIKEGKRKLFPIRLVDFNKIRVWECFDADSGKDLGVEIREFFIPDFSNWKGHDSFEAAFARLLKDLKAEESVGAKQD